MVDHERISSYQVGKVALTRKSNRNDPQLHSHCSDELVLRSKFYVTSSTTSWVRDPLEGRIPTSLLWGRGQLGQHLDQACNCNHYGRDRGSQHQALIGTEP